MYIHSLQLVAEFQIPRPVLAHVSSQVKFAPKMTVGFSSCVKSSQVKFAPKMTVDARSSHHTITSHKSAFKFCVYCTLSSMFSLHFALVFRLGLDIPPVLEAME